MNSLPRFVNMSLRMTVLEDSVAFLSTGGIPRQKESVSNSMISFIAFFTINKMWNVQNVLQQRN